jgi:septal ring factor EnvC (AmiA/AmiB activator)
VTFSHDGARVIAADWTGKITVWETNKLKPIAELAANPPTLSEQLAAAEARLKELQSGNAKPSAAQVEAQAQLAKLQKELADASNAVAHARSALAPKETETAKLKDQLAKTSTPELQKKVAAARQTRNAARLAVTNAITAFNAKTKEFAKFKAGGVEEKPADPAQEIAELQSRIARLKTGAVYANVYHAKEAIAAKKREQEKLLASGTKADKSAAEKLAKEIARQEKELQKLTSDYQKMKSAEAPATVKQAKL